MGQFQSDYHRACEVAGYVGKIACGRGEVLLLGDEPLRSAFYCLADQTLVIARWWSCKSAARAGRALRELPHELFALEDRVPFVAKAESQILFDAAHRGAEPGDHRLAMIAPNYFSSSALLHAQPRRTARRCCRLAR